MIEREYNKDDKESILEVAKDLKIISQKEKLLEKLGVLLSRSSDVASISSLIVTLITQLS